MNERNFVVRKAKEEDLKFVVDITNYYIRTSACTMKEKEESLDEIKNQFHKRDLQRFPLIVAVTAQQQELIGWGELSAHSQDRAGYRFSVHDSVYVRNDFKGFVVGTLLLRELIAQARVLGYRSVIAVVESSQIPSVSLHIKNGFKEVGKIEQFGFKFDHFLDILYFQLLL